MLALVDPREMVLQPEFTTDLGRVGTGIAVSAALGIIAVSDPYAHRVHVHSLPDWCQCSRQPLRRLRSIGGTPGFPSFWLKNGSLSSGGPGPKRTYITFSEHTDSGPPVMFVACARGLVHVVNPVAPAYLGHLEMPEEEGVFWSRGVTCRASQAAVIRCPMSRDRDRDGARVYLYTGLGPSWSHVRTVALQHARLRRGWVHGIRFTNDGTSLLAASDCGSVGVVPVAGDARERVINPDRQRGHGYAYFPPAVDVEEWPSGHVMTVSEHHVNFMGRGGPDVWWALPGLGGGRPRFNRIVGGATTIPGQDSLLVMHDCHGRTRLSVYATPMAARFHGMSRCRLGWMCIAARARLAGVQDNPCEQHPAKVPRIPSQERESCLGAGAEMHTGSWSPCTRGLPS